MIIDNEGENWDDGDSLPTDSSSMTTNVATFSTTAAEGGGGGVGGEGTTYVSAAMMCGSGSIGNGQCPIITDCCSQYGYCGTDPEHCATTLPPVAAAAGTTGTGTGAATIPTMMSTGIVEQTTTGGTCGGGNVGNGECPITTDCCSEYGFCGTSIEHCTASTTTTANTGTTTTTVQQQDTTGLAIVYPSPGVSTSIPASTIGQIVYPSPATTLTMQQTQQQFGTISTPPPASSTTLGGGVVETPQFNSNGILIPAVPTSQQQITSPQVYGTCGRQYW